MVLAHPPLKSFQFFNKKISMVILFLIWEQTDKLNKINVMMTYREVGKV